MPRTPRTTSTTEPTDDATPGSVLGLRFPQFQNRDAWDALNGDELFDLVDRRPAAPGLPVLAITQEHGPIPRDQIDYHVSVTDASLASYKEVRPKDFIISLRSFQGGIEYSRFRGICSPAYVILNRKGDGSDDFYRHLFKSERFIQQLTRNIEGLRDGKMISYKQFSEQLLPAPLRDEQQKIADCLTSLDEVIAAQGRKVEALKAHKKGLMQHLFPQEGQTLPRLRFAEFRDGPEWEVRPLSRVAENLDGKRVPITENERVKGATPYYGASGIVDFVEGHLFDEDLLCVSEDGANLVARTYPVAFSISGKTWVNNHAHVLRFDERATQTLVEAYLNEIDLAEFITGMAMAVSEATDPSELLNAALAYAAAGWQVFPLHTPAVTESGSRCSCGEAKCKSVGKHPRTKRGLKDATTDEATIRGWWTRWPTANIGMRTGPASNLMGIDIDPRHGGDVTLAGLTAKHGELPATVVAETGGGGQHVLLAHPGGRIKSRTVAAGIDCKADGGYIVVAPSLHASGRRYAWRAGQGPGEVEIAAAPDWVLELVRSGGRQKKQRARSKAEADAGPILEGGRNEFLTSLAGKLRRGGHDQPQIEAALLAENVVRCEPPLSEDEVRGIAASVSQYLPGGGVMYRMNEYGIFHDRPTTDGIVPGALTNFRATIVTDIVEDDGVETARRFEIRGAMTGTAPATITITAEQFEAMGWHIPLLGCRAVIFPGYNGEAHARTAIQLLSIGAVSRRVYGHTGWREVGGRWTYLHGDGGINTDGMDPTVLVSLTGSLAGVVLPPPPAGEERIACVCATLDLLTLGPDRLTYPLVAAIIRAILGVADFSVFIVGPTGTKKSETASLAQRHFGQSFSRTNLPLGWSSTVNAIEECGFRAKDMILVVDDFKPSGDLGGDAKLNQAADRVIRGQGNGAGRGRMRPDGGLRAPRPPRGLYVMTGEDLPRGESLRARLLIQEINPGDIDDGRLTICQEHAEAGRFVGTTAAFCQWAAGRLPELQGEIKGRRDALRGEFPSGHARMPGMLAELFVAFSIFIRFARESGAADAEGAAVLTEACRDAMTIAGKGQSQHQTSAEPTARFLELLSSAISSGRAHIAGMDGTAPPQPGRWGWRAERVGAVEEWRSHGDRVGWVDGEEVYLDAQSAFRIVQACAAGEPVAVAVTTLPKRLHERGHLVTTDEKRNSLKVRRTIEGKRLNVLHLHASAVAEPDCSGGEAHV